jgi:hypothetical protein
MQDTSPKPFVFVLMPFDKEFDDVYKLGIKPACEKAGAYAERVDEQIFHESILQRIYNQIAKADIIVADMTGRNPNVFYETGYAHALGKLAILLTKNSEDIPFDLKHYPHIVYSGRISDLLPELGKRVRWAIEHSSVPPDRIVNQIGFYINGVSLSDNPVFKHPIHSGKTQLDTLHLEIDAHNLADKIIRSENFQLGIKTSRRIDRVVRGKFSYAPIALPDGQYLYLPEGLSFQLLPDCWDSFRLELSATPPLKEGDHEVIWLIKYSEEGSQDFPFIVECSKANGAS